MRSIRCNPNRERSPSCSWVWPVKAKLARQAPESALIKIAEGGGPKRSKPDRIQRAMTRPMWIIHSRPNPLSPTTTAKVLEPTASESEPAMDAAVKTSQETPLARAMRQANIRLALKRLRIFNDATVSPLENMHKAERKILRRRRAKP
jgi:hypothetical protein